jgi:hypothetical protein
MAMMSFTVQLYVKGAEALPEMVQRLKDPTPLWQTIMDDWGRHNVEKFDASAGMGMLGAWIDRASGVFWKPLSAAYLRHKIMHGQPNQIMVATGSLLDSLSSSMGFFNINSADRLVFGTPNDPDNAAKVAFNWDRRQTIFLSEPDQRRIQSAVSQYLRVPMKDVREEVAKMDVEFKDASGG